MAKEAVQPGSSRRQLSLSQSLSPSRCSRAVLSPSTGKPCLVCFDRERDGIECEGGGHFVCRSCLQGFIQSLDGGQIRRSGGGVSCPGMTGGHPCEASPWSYDDLADLLDIKTQKIYVSRLSSVLASVLSSASLQQQGSVAPDPRMSMSMSRHHRRRSSQTHHRWPLGRAGTRGVSLCLAPGEEATEAAALGEQQQQQQEEEEELRWHRQVIDDQILTLTCPREGCRRAFLDFEGCFALSCPSCGAGFCAACVIDCGDDAHEHCRSVHHGYYGTFEAFLEVHRVRRLTAVAAYLHSLLLPPPPASPSAPLGSPVFATRTPEQAGALVEALLTGPLALDLKEVGIDVEDVRRVLASIKDGRGAGPGAVAVAPKLFGAGAAVEAAPAEAGEAVGGAAPIRLHYSHEQARRHYRRLLDGPGYPPEDDALSRLLGSCLTGSSMVAAVWWLTAAEGEAGRLPWVLAALVVGPAGVLLGTGRGRQVAQALWVTLLAGLLYVPLYLGLGTWLSSWAFFAFVKVGGVFLHALGFAADATMEGMRILRSLASVASPSHLAALAQRFKRALDVVGLLPPDDAVIPTATA